MEEPIAGSPQLAASIGRRLRDVRRARGWSQQALAEGHFSKGYVSSIEHGKIFPSVRALQALAARLGVDMSEFFDPELVGAGAAAEPDHALQEARRGRLLIQEVRALAALGQPGAAARARQIAADHLPVTDQVALQCALATAYLAGGDGRAALNALEGAVEALAPVPRTPAVRVLAMRLQTLLGAALLAHGSPDLAAAHFARLREEPLEDPGLRLAALSGLAQALAAAGDVPQARAVYHEALELARETRSLARLAQEYLTRSRQAAAEERWDDADRLAEEAVVLAEADQTLRAGLTTYLRYGELLRPGYPTAARPILAAAVEFAGQLNVPATLAQAEAELALLELESGHGEAAHSAVERAAQAATQTGDAGALGRVAYVRARLALDAEQPDVVLAHLESAARLLTAPDDRGLSAEVCFALARLLVAQGRPEEATAYYEQAFAAQAGLPA